jgi:hypothetical protein
MSLQHLIARRTALVERIAQQRVDLAILTQPLERPASYFDRGYTLVQKIKQQPKLLFGAVTLGAILFRKRLPIAKVMPFSLMLAKWLFKYK